MTNTCARCGGPGHYAKTCPFPPLGRPDLKRIRDGLRGCQSKGERTMQRATAVKVFDRLFAYIEHLEAARRSLLTEIQRRLAA